MAYRQDGYKGNPAWVGAVVLVLMLGWCVARVGPAASTSPEAITDQLVRDPEGGPMFKVIQEGFPQDLHRLASDLSDRTARGEDHAALEIETRTFLADMSRQHRTDLVSAPHKQLADIETAQLAVIEYLRGTSAQLCAKFSTTGVSLNELPPGDARTKLTGLMVAEWRAIIAGRDAPVARDSAALLPADRQAVMAAIRADRLSPGELDAMTRRSMAGSGDPQAECNIALHTFRALQTLPSDQSDRVMAWTLRQQAS